MEWGMLGDEGLLSGSEEPPASPRLNLWSRKWNASGLSKSCQWEAEVSFLTVKDLKCHWLPRGKRRTSGIQRERRKWSRLWQLFSRTRGSAGDGAGIAGKAGTRQRGSEPSVHAGRCWRCLAGLAKQVLIPAVSSFFCLTGCRRPSEYPGERNLSLVGCVCEWVCGGGSA